MVICPGCNTLLEEVVDTFYSNTNTKRCACGQHTGDGYYCNVCETGVIDDFLSGEVRFLGGYDE